MSLFDDLSTREGTKENIYVDTAGIPTIGVGYNLQNSEILKDVLNQFGYSVSSLGRENFNNLVNVLHDKFTSETWTNANKDTKISEVNTILSQYKTTYMTPNSDAWNNARSSFAFNNVADMQPIFNAAIPDFDKKIVNQLQSQLQITHAQAQEIFDRRNSAEKDNLRFACF